MLQSKVKKSLKRLASKVKGVNNNGGSGDEHESLRGLRSDDDQQGDNQDSTTSPKSPSPGYFAVYVGEERQRFMVKTKYLMHPLFKILLEKASEEFGFEQRDALVVPCSVSAFQEAISAIESSQGKFDFGKLVENSCKLE